MARANSTPIPENDIPDLIVKEAKTALSYYPELKNIKIIFKLKPSLRNSFMKAQPLFTTLWNAKQKRAYIIYISTRFVLDHKTLALHAIPKEVLVGWLGHELGHVMDYHRRSGFNLIGFGIRYLFSNTFIRKAERIADTYAVRQGMQHYILATKDFILNHADLSEKYKSKIRKLYLSPDEILAIVQHA